MQTVSRFACDAMLGGLARWLRAAGYDATWQHGIADWDLIRHAREDSRALLSCDRGIFQIGTVRDGLVKSLRIPNGLSTQQQLTLVLQAFNLSLSQPRCMLCGGELRQIPREQAVGEVPKRTLQWLTEFFRCTRCARVFWKGTHWNRIQPALNAAAAGSPMFAEVAKTR
ncbi:MAG TPA: Mut7-C RNAse domain-containing protein [Planctomycetota bacterium]|nr:Mut7-C RNAse domain-containing protein [Planctomycetota bacterium]